MYKNKTLTSVPAPLPPALKSPQHYVESITKVAPQWAGLFHRVAIKSLRTLAALWAGAVAVGNGARISEVLRLRGFDLMPNGCAVVVGSKGSNARTIYTGLDAETAIRLKTIYPHRPLFGVLYKEVWETLVKHGLAVQEPSHVNRSVTHAGRYELAQDVAKNHGEVVAGQALGHRSKSAVQHYTHPEEQGKRSLIRKHMDAHWGLKIQGPQLPAFLVKEEV